jgi:hypothetical protein
MPEKGLGKPAIGLVSDGGDPAGTDFQRLCDVICPAAAELIA